MINGNQNITQERSTQDDPVKEASANLGDLGTTLSKGNGLTRIAVGALIGATLGGIAAALVNRETSELVNQSIRGIGKTAKATSDALNLAVQRIGSSVNDVAANINYATQDVNDAVNSVTANVSETVRSTVSTVKGTADGVNETVKTAMNAVNTVKESATKVQEDIQQAVNADAVSAASSASNNTPNGEMLYKLVPVNPDIASN